MLSRTDVVELYHRVRALRVQCSAAADAQHALLVTAATPDGAQDAEEEAQHQEELVRHSKTAEANLLSCIQSMDYRALVRDRKAGATATLVEQRAEALQSLQQSQARVRELEGEVSQTREQLARALQENLLREGGVP